MRSKGEKRQAEYHKKITVLMVNTLPASAAVMLNKYWIIKGLIPCMMAAFWLFPCAVRYMMKGPAGDTWLTELN